MTKAARFPIAIAVFGVLVVGDTAAPNGFGLLEAPAHAIVGAPMTPVSVAGVARRTTRRTVVVTSAAASSAAATPQAPPPPPPPPPAPPPPK